MVYYVNMWPMFSWTEISLSIGLAVDCSNVRYFKSRLSKCNIVILTIQIVNVIPRLAGSIPYRLIGTNSDVLPSSLIARPSNKDCVKSIALSLFFVYCPRTPRQSTNKVFARMVAAIHSHRVAPLLLPTVDLCGRYFMYPRAFLPNSIVKSKSCIVSSGKKVKQLKICTSLF